MLHKRSSIACRCFSVARDVSLYEKPGFLAPFSPPNLLAMTPDGHILSITQPRAKVKIRQRQRKIAAIPLDTVGLAVLRCPGEQLVYTVRIANTGDGSVGAAWMTDTLPSEVDYAGSLNATTGSWGVMGDVITWTGSLASSEVATVTFATQIKSTLSENTCFTNTAEITGAGTLVQAQVPARAVTHFDLYLPIIIRNYPPRPDLNDIPAPGANDSYIVSWSSVSGADQYVLQEATDTNFTSVTRVFTTTETSQVVSLGSSYGTLYYRVRADDDDRWGQGPWSDPESVEVPYFDDFSDSGSGWPKRATEVIPESDSHYRLRYENGQYRIMVDRRARHLVPPSGCPGPLPASE